MLINLVELSSGALETFKNSTIEEKRKIVNFIFANLELTDGRLEYSLRQPFDLFVKSVEIGEWWAIVDSFRTNIGIKLILPI